MSHRQRTKNTRWVISVGPHWQGGGPGSKDRFIGQDGLPTDSASQAEKFFGFQEASDFASAKGIVLDGAMRYVRLADFPDSDLRPN